MVNSITPNPFVPMAPVPNKPEPVNETARVTPIDDRNNSAYAAEWGHPERQLSNILLEKSLLGYYALTDVLYRAVDEPGKEIDDGLDIIHSAFFLERETLAPPPLKTTGVNIAGIQYLPYLEGSEMQEKWMALLYKLYQNLSKHFKEKDLHLLFTADMGADDALLQFQNHTAATKHGWARGHNMFDETVKDVMAYFLARLFNIYDVLAVEPIFRYQEWVSLKERECARHLISTTLMDLIVMEKLLSDSPPKGYTQFSLVSEEKNKNQKEIRLKLRFFKSKKVIESYDLVYAIEKREVMIKNGKHTYGICLLKEENGVISGLSGLLNGTSIQVKHYPKGVGIRTTYEIGAWKSDDVMGFDHIQEGTFVQSPLWNQRPIEIHDNVRKRNSITSVYKKVRLGEDEYYATYLFKDGISLPLSAVGIIKSLYQ